MAQFDIQEYLIQMEIRLNQRFDRVEDSINDVDDRTVQTDKTAIALNGRVTSLEEKAGWIKGGITAAIIGTIGGLIPHIRSFFGHP